MAKKKLKKKLQSKSPVGKLSDQVVESARDIWLAGLGAFSVAQEESGKMVEQGNKLFERLVKEGRKIEKDTRGAADRTVDDLRDEVESRVDSVRQQATDNWDKLENIFEDRVARVLGRLGVPTADDVNKLSARVQRLTDQVADLSAKDAPKPEKKATRKKTTRKTAAKKTASKKATAKKPAAKKTTKKASAS
jgi:poly(hydroxyalkanoate) granule-associated protein